MTSFFARNSVRFGPGFYQADMLGAFAVVECRMTDPRQWLLDASGVRVANRDHGLMIDGWNIILDALGGRWALPHGWFFLSADEARSAVVTFLEAVAQPLDAKGLPDEAERWRRGEALPHEVVRERAVLQRAARAAGAIMGRDHDVKTLSLAIDWAEAKARLNNLKAADPTSAGPGEEQPQPRGARNPYRMLDMGHGRSVAVRQRADGKMEAVE